jgi:hypothetical protein
MCVLARLSWLLHAIDQTPPGWWLHGHFEDESTSRLTDLAAPSDRSNTRSAFLHGQQQQVLGLQKYKYEYEIDGLVFCHLRELTIVVDASQTR